MFKLVAPSGKTIASVGDVPDHRHARSLLWAKFRDQFYPKSGERPKQPCRFYEAQIVQVSE